MSSPIFTILIDNSIRCFKGLSVGECITFFSENGSAGGIRRTSKNFYIVCFIDFFSCVSITTSSLSSSIKKLEKFFK